MHLSGHDPGKKTHMQNNRPNRHLVYTYDLDTHETITYDTTTYTPVLEAPEAGWTYLDKLTLEQEANGQNLIFARTKKGKVWKIALYAFNKKSVSLNDTRNMHHTGLQRLRYEDLESFGTCATVEANGDAA